MKYLISFDLPGKGRAQDRKDLDAMLEAAGAQRALESQWVVDADDTAEAACTILMNLPMVKKKDRFLVPALADTITINGETVPGYASRNLI